MKKKPAIKITNNTNEQSELLENELARAVKEVEWCLNNEHAEWRVWSDEFQTVLTAAKRSQELEQKLNEWSNKELLGETERCRLQALEQSCREKDELIEKCKDIIRRDNIFLKDWLRGRVHPGVSRLINEGEQAVSQEQDYGQQKEK